MNIFICWSGRRSKEVAEALREWLPTVLDGLVITYSPDIEKGEPWFNSIGLELRQSRAGLVCLTPENLQSDWIHFEAGALFRETAKIFPYLYKVTAGEVHGPLSHFQNTEANQGDTKKLMVSIAELMADEAPARESWEAGFTAQWPALDTRLKQIKSLTMSELVPHLGDLFQKKTYLEPLDECTNQKWRDRYDRARATSIELERARAEVRRNAAPHLFDYYEELIQAVDGYCMEMETWLLSQVHFDTRKDGKLDMADAILGPCERRRRQILGLLNDLKDEHGRPILDESRLYRKLLTVKDMKQLIQPFEQRIKQGEIPEGLVPRGLTSQWEFDRIVYYLIQENRADFSMEHVIECIMTELEKVRAREEEGSLVPLHYAIRALERGLWKFRRGQTLSAEIKSDVRRLAERVERYLRAKSSRDAGGHIKENLAALLKALE